MMISTEKIEPPPPVPLAGDEITKMIAEKLMEEDRWVKDFIQRLAYAIREVTR
jgi:hypothetical protein